MEGEGCDGTEYQEEEVLSEQVLGSEDTRRFSPAGDWEWTEAIIKVL